MAGMSIHASIHAPDAALVLYSTNSGRYQRATLDNLTGFITARCWYAEGVWSGSIEWRLGADLPQDSIEIGGCANCDLVTQALAGVFLNLARQLLGVIAC
jgi:hypothetical protein